MGDSKRNIELAKFLKRNFPQAQNILVVADGKGELSCTLADFGFSVKAIEAKPRLSRRKMKGVQYRKGWFLWDQHEPSDEDLIVGMHPDEATSEIVRYGVRYGIPWCVVPCCIVGRDAGGISNFQGWIKRLKGIAKGDCTEAILNISGKNLTLISKNRTVKK